MGLIVNTSTVIRNLSIGPLSGGGNGGGEGSSEPSYLAVGAYGVSSLTGAAYIYDVTNYSATPTKLQPSGLDADDQFGAAVAATSNHLVVGAVGDDDQGSRAGAVYVFDANNLSATPTKLIPSGLEANDFFGNSVAATSNHIVIGAVLDDDRGGDAGAVYVYDANNLSSTPTKLAPSGLDSGDRFAQSLAVTSNQIVVGAFKDEITGSNTGAVYVYDATNLSATPTKLAPSGLGSNNLFGNAVAATSNYVVVGTPADSDQGGNAGAVYVFDANNLSATPTKLTPSGLGNGDYFGYAVTATSNHIVVGASSDDDQGDNAGAVYVFDANNLSATPTKLAPSGIGAGDNFGSSVTATSNQIIVGASNDDDRGSNAGAVYVYDASNLSAAPTKLTAFDGSSSDNFGYSVSLG